MSRARSRGRRDETTSVEPVRKQQVFALPCQKTPAHRNTRVYRTDGPTRYCVCDDCGHTWKQIGPPAGEDAPEDAAADDPGEPGLDGE